ncbi:DNA ligase 1-like [Schistocerca gregaria]|uniref:DNA ligase 1-like n=1 Tax=Schistocerca gregaria TaxID=7010 RepID=UPI00211E2EBB|nr:DNA ligase 1-like [Schistocerca gregaria]
MSEAFFCPRTKRRDVDSIRPESTQKSEAYNERVDENPAKKRSKGFLTVNNVATPSSLAQGSNTKSRTIVDMFSDAGKRQPAVLDTLEVENMHEVKQENKELVIEDGRREDREEKELTEDNSSAQNVIQKDRSTISICTSDSQLYHENEPIPYLALSRTFDAIRKTRSKLEHISIMREYFFQILLSEPDDLVPAIYLAINQLAPQYEGVQLGVGEHTIQKAISAVTGMSLAAIKSKYEVLGDLGLVAQESRHNVRTIVPYPPLTIRSVYQNLRSIALEGGNGTRDKKLGRIINLMVSSRENEILYIVKTLQAKLRLNLGAKSVMTGLAHALAMYESRPNVPDEDALSAAKTLLREAFSRCPNWKLVISVCLDKKLSSLPETCKLVVGVPVEPMLSQPMNGIGMILSRLKGHELFTAEYKYDGERAQVHLMPDGTIKIYSRNLEDTTRRFPDVVQGLSECVADPELCRSFIIDCEAVAFDLEKNTILPYQILSTRARKDVDLKKITVQVCLYVFDLLYLNGDSLLEISLKSRRELLKSHLRPVAGRLHFATSREFSESEELDSFLIEAVENQCEGLMIKTWDKDARYEPSKRSFAWLKFKKDYSEQMADSVDLVPIGAWYGRGKRTGVYGAYLLACYDEDEEMYQSVCKLATGFKDAQLVEYTASMKQVETPARPQNYSTGLKPDVWFEAVAVWEVRAADLSLSPQHQAAIGLVKEDRGIGLRFPRFLRIREDKLVQQATSSAQIAQMYRNQKSLSCGTEDQFEEDSAMANPLASCE